MEFDAPFSEYCVLTDAVREPPCNYGIVPGDYPADTAFQHHRSAQIAFLRENRLSIFGQTSSYDLTRVPLVPIGGRTLNVERRALGDGDAPVVFTLPYSEYEQAVHVYADYQTSLSGSVYVESNHPVTPLEDGVRFQITVIDAEGTPTGIYDVTCDPHVENAPVPFSINLTPWAGQIIRLHFTTLPRETTERDWALWVAPRMGYQ